MAPRTLTDAQSGNDQWTDEKGVGRVLRAKACRGLLFPGARARSVSAVDARDPQPFQGRASGASGLGFCVVKSLIKRACMRVFQKAWARHMIPFFFFPSTPRHCKARERETAGCVGRGTWLRCGVVWARKPERGARKQRGTFLTGDIIITVLAASARRHRSI